MNSIIELIVDHRNAFEVVLVDESGIRMQVAWGPDLDQCLQQASCNLGHPLMIPMRGP